MSPLKAGAKAPEFTLTGIDGTSRSLSHGDGEPTLLTFFKNTCPTCLLTFPFLQRLHERVAGAPLRFWGISQDSVAETCVFGEEFGLTFPLLPDDPGYPVSNAYGLANVPTLFLVDAGGTIALTTVGFSRADLEALATEFRRRFRIPGVTPLFVEADNAPVMRPG